MTKPRCYLAGGIAGLTDEEMRGWRDTVQLVLGDWFEFVCPTRRDYRLTGDFLASEAVVHPDLVDIRSCQYVLVNVRAPSWGTAMEMVYAWQHGRTVIAFGEGCRSPWVRYHSHYQCRGLEESMVCLRKLVN